jgi:hypothetical protein
MGTMPPPPEAAPAAADEAAPASPAPKINGYVETGYHLLVTHPKGQGSKTIPLRSYDASAPNSFLLHAAHLALTHSFNDQVSAVIEVDAGSDPAVTAGYLPAAGAAFASGTAAGVPYAFDVQEAYLVYKPSEFSITAGKFVTYEGIEVIEGPNNPTLTRGFLFGLAEPFTHVGVKAHYTTEKFDLGLGAVNGWDQMIDTNGAKMLTFRAAVTPSDKFMAAASGYFDIGGDTGDADRGLISLDLTGMGKLSDDFVLWFQGNWGHQKSPVGAGSASWWGAGLQPVYTMNDFSLGGRVEIFGDPKGVRSGLGLAKDTVLNITATPGYKLGGGFVARFELRLDTMLSGKDASGATDKKVLFGGKSTQVSIGVGAHYMF